VFTAGFQGAVILTVKVRPPSRTACDQERYVLQHGPGISVSNFRPYSVPCQTYARRGDEGVMSGMSGEPEKSQGAREETEKSQRAKRREGDSALARFYRRKDELLDWTMDQITALGRDKPAVFQELTSKYFVPIRNLRQALEESPGDEESLAKAVAVMEALSKRAGEVGLRDYPASAEKKQDPSES